MDKIKLSKLLEKIENKTGKKIILESYQTYDGNVMFKFLSSLKGFTNLEILYSYSQPASKKFKIKQILDFIKKNPKDTTYYIWNYSLDKTQEGLYKKKLDAFLAPIVKKWNFCRIEKQKSYDLYMSLKGPENKEKKEKALEDYKKYSALVPKYFKQLNDETAKFDAKIDLISEEDYNIVKTALNNILKNSSFNLKDLQKVLASFTPKQKKVLNCLYLGHTNTKEKAAAEFIIKGGNLD